MPVTHERRKTEMKIDRGLYKYGRLQKARDSRYPSPGTSGQFAYEKNIKSLLGRTPTVEDMERRYPLLAKAERALCLQTETREHETGDNSTALRLNNLGLRQLDSGDIQGAFRSLMDALDHDHGLALAHNNLGLLYLEIGDPSKAIECLRRATHIQANLDVAHGNMGLAYMELGYRQSQRASYQQHSYENLKKALDIDPGEPMHHNNLGILFLELGDPRTGLECFEKAVEAAAARKQENPMYYQNRGIAHEASGDWESANLDFLQASSLADTQMEENMRSA
jgi:Tfp pilus assembly protein PilF